MATAYSIPDLPSGEVMEITAAPPSLYNYVFLAVSSDVTIAGFFVDSVGRQIAAAFAFTIDSTTPKTLSDPSLSAIPIGAKGFVGKISGGDLYFSLGGRFDWEAQAASVLFAPNANCPVIAASVAGNAMYLGRVAG